jgi:hypothetical protein
VPTPTTKEISFAPRRWPASGLTVTETSILPPIPFATDHRLALADGTTHDLAAIGTGLLDCAAWEHALLSPDGRQVAYEAVVSRTRAGAEVAANAPAMSGDVVVPAVRLIDLVTGHDTLVAEGACQPVWSERGALAFVRGTSRTGTVGKEYPGTIAVRSPDGSMSTWLDAAERRWPIGWAGSSLLFERVVGFTSELFVLEPSGKLRMLAANADVVAVSPDGSRVLVTTIPPEPLMTGERATLRLIRLADGAELSTLRLDPEVENLGAGGSWRGDRVVASIGFFGGGISHPDPRLFVINVAGDHLAITNEFFFATRLIGPGPFATVAEPFITGSDVGALWIYAGFRYLQCDLTALRCSLGPDLGPRAQLLR